MRIDRNKERTTIFLEDNLSEIASKLNKNHGFPLAILDRYERYIGLISTGDFVRAVEGQKQSLRSYK